MNPRDYNPEERWGSDPKPETYPVRQAEASAAGEAADAAWREAERQTDPAKTGTAWRHAAELAEDAFRAAAWAIPGAGAQERAWHDAMRHHNVRAATAHDRAGAAGRPFEERWWDIYPSPSELVRLRRLEWVGWAGALSFVAWILLLAFEFITYRFAGGLVAIVLAVVTIQSFGRVGNGPRPRVRAGAAQPK